MEEEGRKANLNAPVSEDPVSRAAFHPALHVEGGGRREEVGGLLEKKTPPL